MEDTKYKDMDWAEGSPVEGERYASNAHFTGQHLGAPMQDAADTNGANEDPYYREHNTARFGTITQDAAGEMPELDTGEEPETEPENPGGGEGA